MNTREVVQLVLPHSSDESSHDGRRLDAQIETAMRACHDLVGRGYRRW